MSDARLLLAELDATEHLLRSLAVDNLDYGGIIGVERAADRVCRSVLARLGPALDVSAPVAYATLVLPPVEESTDELLTGAVGADNAPPFDDGVPEFDGELEELGEAEVTDETPASSSEVLLRWNTEGRPALAAEDEEDPTLADGRGLESDIAAADAYVDEEAARLQASLEAEVAGEVPSWQEAEPEAEAEAEAEPAIEEEPEEPASYVDETPSYVDEVPAYEDETWEQRSVAESEPTPRAPSSGGDPWANLVTFSHPEKEEVVASAVDDLDDDPWEEQRKMAREAAQRVPVRPAVMDPGRDALATSQSHMSREELLPEGEPEIDEIEELELEPENDVAFEDEAATVIRAAPTELASRATPSPAARAVPPKPSPRAGGTPIGGTAGLYGSAAVPTIRDSDDPRPRAAAIQLNAGGAGARVLGAEEEDEPIEIGEASDDELGDDDGGGGGFSVKVQEYEQVQEEVEEPEELEESEEDEEPPLEPDVPAGPTPEAVRSMLAGAQAAALSGNLQGGADLYTDLLDQDPDNIEAHVSRGRLYLDLGDYSRAMSDFMVAEDLAPTDPEPQVAIGDLYFARKDYRKAIDYFDQALQMAPNHAMAFCRRGISHYYRKNYADAVTDLEKARKIDPEIANIQTYISMAKKKVGK